MRRAPARLLALIPLVSLAACCTPERCQPAALPFQGVATVASEMFVLAQFAARQECDDTLYDLLSNATRDELSQFGWGWIQDQEIEPYPYRFEDVLRGAEYVATLPGLEPNQEFLYVEYEEPGKPNLFVQILIVNEVDPEIEGDTVRPKVGLFEQIKRIEAGDGRYFWDAGR